MKLFSWCVTLLLAATTTYGVEFDFQRDIRPILSNVCFHCHGPDGESRKGGNKKIGGLRLDTEDGSRADHGGSIAIVPGSPEKSELIKRIITKDEDDLMPPPESGKPLTSREIALLTAWVKAGGKYEQHWSYVKPRRPELPGAAANPIDAFIQARLKAESLKPSAEADRSALIRRVSLDLTGLPPSLKEIDEFVKDTAPGAYERVVDRLLASPSYGEHWGRLWLDLARYADSTGYADDVQRTIWLFRDYVIRSFNLNKPFDQFTIEQLAGDLLPKPTDEQLVATAFHRNTMTNNEGGTQDEEFRNAAVVDRVNTTMEVWMGTSIACAQCHTHKTDPITNAEYFGLFAFFNNTEDSDKNNESPVLKTRPFDKKEDKKEDKKDDKKDDKDLVTVPIMRELAGNKRRTTKVQIRGNYQVLGEVVKEGVPAAFPPLPAHAPRNRLGLAQWLVDQENPLTSRVIANRFWEAIFGIGLVRTSEEFGGQGDLPSHPELLDWLATELVREKWDMKKFLRLIVTSATYRQSSRVTPELAERDPDNRLLARGPRFRLSAEEVRDQALAASGLLSAKMFGPSVRPERPELGLSAAFGKALDWKTSDGEDRYRRGLYTEWRRTSPYPSMSAFDAPSREICTLRRSRTNTPIQAMVTLNDPVFIEAAQALARRMAEQGKTPEEYVTHGFRRVLARAPSASELKRLVALYGEALTAFKSDAKRANDMATNPIGPVPAGADVAQLAASTVVASVLLNLDETLMKR